MTVAFEHWPKIPRASNTNAVFTEKIDGTNAQIYIPGPGTDAPPIGFFVGSRNRWIVPDSDNYGFARWAYENAEKLLRLGPGRHYGEWWGQGIQRGYALSERRFSLFDARRWTSERLAERELTDIVHAVPILGIISIEHMANMMQEIEIEFKTHGSTAAPGFMQPEGYVVQIGEGRFKVTDAKQGQKEMKCVSNPTPQVVAPLPYETLS